MGSQSLGVGPGIPAGRDMNRKHGMSGTRVHNIWLGMLDRCENDRSGDYGARGILVCDKWRSFEAFYADMGDPPGAGYSIDRIDVNGHYEPSNCRWATRTEQARNTRANTILRMNGQAMTIAAWSDRTGIKPATICFRLAHGWGVEKTLMTPVRSARIGQPWEAVGMSRSALVSREGFMKRGFCWSVNPFVWVISFKRIAS